MGGIIGIVIHPISSESRGEVGIGDDVVNTAFFDIGVGLAGVLAWPSSADCIIISNVCPTFFRNHLGNGWEGIQATVEVATYKLWPAWHSTKLHAYDRDDVVCPRCFF